MACDSSRGLCRHRNVAARLKTVTSSSVSSTPRVGGLYAAVEYVREILPTFTPAEEKDRYMLEQIILPYLDRQLKAAE